ncbi:cathepsin 7-like isoform X1 [Peromyscus californicus insignis]|uniref:cathepsin 7-like isoform X1 n=1 Tax=Peromyscus californicus insignis TaxID=564181 RepID=UPI0022A6878C|nr:cathepsin 7-like isoform X1 [Peromyscus californicus insignis]
MIPAVFLVILCLGVASGAPKPDYSLDAEWEEWKRSYEKTYTQEEERQKRAVWEENVKMIKLHSEGNGLGMNNFTVEMNEFGDMTGEEMRKMMMESSVLTLRNGKRIQKRGDPKFPKTLDWRTQGYVTPVRRQGGCGACWAFAVAGSIEGQLFKKTGKLIPLSVQNLIDCSRSFGTNGCKGGMMYNAFQYVKNNGGLEAEATYPYEAKEGRCRYRPERSVVKVTRFLVVPRNEEALMNALVTHGPIAVGIDAGHESFTKYTGGIYHEPNCRPDSPNHSALLVGFGYEGRESEGRKYWLVKNSHGENWGEKGYIKIPRDQNNYCGIASYAMYPIL